MRKIRKGDEVVVIAGKDKGKKGRVLAMVGEEKVLVDGCALVKKHVRPNPAKNIEGGIVEKSLPIHISNVALVCSDSKTGYSRVGIVKNAEGKNTRVYKATGDLVNA